MNKQVTKTLLVLLLLGIVAGIITGCVYDDRGTPPPTCVPRFKITVHGTVYYCQNYSSSGSGSGSVSVNLTLIRCQGFLGQDVIIRGVQDFSVENYQPTPGPGERG